MDCHAWRQTDPGARETQGATPSAEDFMMVPFPKFEQAKTCPGTIVERLDRRKLICIKQSQY
jgi:hypothetical protein